MAGIGTGQDGARSKNLFCGMSMLRADEKKKESSTKPGNSAMQDYLKKYMSGGDAEGDDKKKKKKKKSKTDAGGVKIVDEDVSGFAAPMDSAGAVAKRQAADLEGADEDDDGGPVVVNEAEARKLREQIQKAKNYYARGADGSGWAVAGSAGAGTSGRAAASDASPPRRQRHDSPDASPPRRQRHDSPDASPPRRRRHDSPDAAVPRRQRHDSPDASPPRRQRHDSPDASPPRRPQAQQQGHRQPQQSAADASPPRRRRHDSPDASPPRRQRHDSPDASPPRRPQAAAAAAAAGAQHAQQQGNAGHKRRADSPDASPPRKRPGAAEGGQRQRHDSPDASPPRRQAAAGAAGEGGRSLPRMADGTTTGLVSAEVLRAEAQRMMQEREQRRLNAAGQGQETVYRDRATGRIVTKEEFAEDRRKGKKPKTKEEEAEEQYLEWRSGLAQKRAAEERAAAARAEMARPFARSEDDSERDALLRQRTHFGDPMAHLVKRKAPGEELDVAAVTDRYDSAAMQKSGFVIPQGVPAHSWLKRGVAAPSNRYNIRPGRHWDGVDRSNGFERQMFMYQNARRAQELEARQFMQSDM